MALQAGAIRQFLLLASFITCTPLIGEYLKVEMQSTFATLHSPNREDPLHSWLATCQAPIEDFLRNLQDKLVLVIIFPINR